MKESQYPSRPVTDLAVTTTEEVKSCCAALYETEWMRLLLGESFHPGGLKLTERLGRFLLLDPGMVVLDAACGRGDSALHLARTFGCRVIGVDLGADNVAAALVAAREQGLEDVVSFRVGDAEWLPIEDASVDAVICECAFCTFPDKRRAAVEFARVLRGGGVVGLSDITRFGEIPADLQSLIGWISCIADARPIDEYLSYLGGAGLKDASSENHDDALGQMVSEIRARLLGLELLVKLGDTTLPLVDFEQAKVLAKAAANAVRIGQLGYSLVRATK